MTGEANPRRGRTPSRSSQSSLSPSRRRVARPQAKTSRGEGELSQGQLEELIQSKDGSLDGADRPSQKANKPVNKVGQATPSPRPAELAALDRLRQHGRAAQAPTPAEPAEWSNTRDPKLLAELVQELVQREGWQAQLSVADLVVRWDQIVGAVNAEHCQPVGFDRGVLTIQADSSAWASAIVLNVGAIQDQIDQAVGSGLVNQIKVRGPAGPPGAPGRWRVKPRL